MKWRKCRSTVKLVIGYRWLLPELEAISEWILKHHEWWNGAGYPLGIAGAKIPLECRILAIADAYDAMTNDRPYRPAMSHQAAIDRTDSLRGNAVRPGTSEAVYLH
jgi:HD-GYP domain-containing protein (c-di-GMP phosphodiesterase class II)